ncbi:MAG: hypothetical protein A2289_03295 [Deltaproteobacteria bacterium RIFOXYA12_FULL_58_15]|nr:MAG: hypothetical protein A2289_03295 [Deltaproteobacteria bacterium RIFOXYA12_FULL_58_15]OGR15312.1 MAG: hypothetical protein A2341_09865 [Deltaproteobacteria bacterium RIFOXYB12_FULL_58_9]
MGAVFQAKGKRIKELTECSYGHSSAIIGQISVPPEMDYSAYEDMALLALPWDDSLDWRDENTLNVDRAEMNDGPYSFPGTYGLIGPMPEPSAQLDVIVIVRIRDLEGGEPDLFGLARSTVYGPTDDGTTALVPRDKLAL